MSKDKLAVVEIVRIYKTHVWIESDMIGARHVMLQHETCDPFTYCTFNYQYGYTDNSGTMHAATQMALGLGAKEPVEHRSRTLQFPTKDEIEEQIEALQGMLKAKSVRRT